MLGLLCVFLLQNILSCIRFYRDYSIADFSFVLVTTIFASYTTFSSAQIRASVCEELGRHPDLMRDMTEMGLSIENCEIWFERAVIAVVAVILVLIVMRVSKLERLSGPTCHLASCVCVHNGTKWAHTLFFSSTFPFVFRIGARCDRIVEILQSRLARYFSIVEWKGSSGSETRAD